MRKTQVPVVRHTPNDPVSESISDHPAYAQIGAFRQSGGSGCLYGSDFVHEGQVVISISRSELHRGLSRDWAHPREEYIEVALSEAQWATFVSTLNSGSGTQCTLTRKDGDLIPGLPIPENRKDQFKGELKERLALAEGYMKELRAKIGAASLSAKGKQELLSSLHMAEMNLSSNCGFVADQFGEHMETITEHAKIEVAAYVESRIQRAGLQAIQGQQPIAFIEATNEQQGDSK